MAILLTVTVLFFILVMVGSFMFGLSLAQKRDHDPLLRHLTQA